MSTEKSNKLKELSLILVLSALGGLTSVFVGYLGQILSTLMLASFVAPQLLSGLHVFWLILAALMVDTRGSATVTGALKGLIEASFFSHLGVFSFLVSLVEGVIVDLVFVIFKRKNAFAIYLAGGVSSASNIIIIQLFFLPPLPALIYAAAYLASFISGVLLGSYLANQVLKNLPSNLRTVRPTQIAH